MKSLRTVVAVLLLAVLAAALYGWWRTAPASGVAHTLRSGEPAAGPPAALVDRSALDTARKLQPLAATPEEQALAETVVATADHLLDLGFAAALREATEHPAPLTPEAEAAQRRVDSAAQRLVADNLQIQRLTTAVATAKSDASGALDGELALAHAQFEVDQYELNQAGRELIEAGGDLRGKIQALVAEHQAANAKPAAPVIQAPVKFGLVHLLERWNGLRRKESALAAARSAAQATVTGFAAEHQALAERIAAQGRATQASAPAGDAGPRAPEVSAALLARTRQIAADQQALASVGERGTAAQDLVRQYDEWLAIATEQSSATLHRVLLAVAIIVAVCLLLLFFDGWLGAAFGRLRLDRRQVDTLRTVTTVSLQIAAVLFILLVIIGPPGQLGTFLGLAGAGLTVALKDFIVAFVGWLVLMGKNGIRLGDWVEINGVSGEVVELGMFHTVLLETGNWTDSGHPTGRRVTFTNSFAIEGHYFNFSTTGQWLWDELQLVVPAGQDLYAVVDAISTTVKAATAENARQAEEEWRKATPTRKTKGITAAPAINVKPVVGGTEISLRYIARANERYRLRAELYQAAVDLLGPKAAAGARHAAPDPAPAAAPAPG